MNTKIETRRCQNDFSLSLSRLRRIRAISFQRSFDTRGQDDETRPDAYRHPSLASNVFDQHVAVVPVLSVRLNSLVGGSRAAAKSLDQRSVRMR